MAYKASVTVVLSGDEGQSIQVVATSHRIESLAAAGEKIGAAVQKALEEAVGFGDSQRQKLVAAQAQVAALNAALESEKAKASTTATAQVVPTYAEEKSTKKYHKRSDAS